MTRSIPSLCLFAAVLAAPLDAATPQLDEQAKRDWAARLTAAEEEGGARASFALGLELASLPPEDGFAILAQSWERIGSVSRRQQLLKAWHYDVPYPLHARMHPRLLGVLDLGIRDPSPEVQDWAFGYLTNVAVQDFSGDREAYERWFAAHRDLDVELVYAESVRRFLEEAQQAEGGTRTPFAEMLGEVDKTFRDVPAARQAALEAGLPELLEDWLGSGDAFLVRGPMDALRHLSLDEAYLRRVVLPLLGPAHDTQVRSAALGALGEADQDWVVEPILDTLVHAATRESKARSVIWSGARALADIGDPRVIPTLIGCIAAEDGYDTVYGIGWFALHPLTGVDYDESHDGAWWREWWEENRERYPEGVGSLAIPTLVRELPEEGEAGPEPDDVAGIPTQDLRAKRDERKRYFLIGPRPDAGPPAEGYRVLLVLPGGDGSADFLTFVKRIYENSTDGSYVFAQLVAPKWDEKQFESIVWPTKKNRWPEMEFSTEEFVEAVVDDLAERVPIDRKRVFTLAWSSGGPAAYAASVFQRTSVTGSFVAMSVFKPETLPSLRAAKGHAYYVLHSPQDWIPFAMAERAREELTERGARVELTAYQGGHGWQGDVYGNIRAGLEWLQENAGTGRRR